MSLYFIIFIEYKVIIVEDKISRDKNKIKVFSSLLIIVLLVMGVSFAIFQNFARQSGTNNLGATNCFSVTFEGG